MYWYIHSVKLHKNSEENVERLKFKANEYNKLFYKECHWADCQYHDIDEVWTELKVGTLLQPERDKDNRYDKMLLLFSTKSSNQTIAKRNF